MICPGVIFFKASLTLNVFRSQLTIYPKLITEQKLFGPELRSFQDQIRSVCSDFRLNFLSKEHSFLDSIRRSICISNTIQPKDESRESDQGWDCQLETFEVLVPSSPQWALRTALPLTLILVLQAVQLPQPSAVLITTLALLQMNFPQTPLVPALRSHLVESHSKVSRERGHTNSIDSGSRLYPQASILRETQSR
jgi:hypothetical protein